MARIRVLNRATGQIGSVSEEFFNPSKYQRVGSEARMPQASPSPSYASTPVTTDLQGQQGPSLQGFLQNVGRNVGEFGQGIGNLAQMAYKSTPISYLLNPNKEQAKQETLGAYKQLGHTAVNLPGAVISDLGSLISNPLDYAYNKPLDAILNLLPLVSGAKTVGRLGKAALLGREALGTVGKEAASVAGREALGEGGQVAARISPKIGLLDYLSPERKAAQLGRTAEEIAVAGGSVPEDLIRRHLGTPSVPNPELLQGLALGSSEEGLRNELRSIIAKSGAGAEELAPQTFENIFQSRKAAGKAAKSYYKALKTGGAYSPSGELMGRVQKAYSNILKEGLPEITPYDEAFSKLKGYSSGLGKHAGNLKRSAQFILTAKLLNNILGRVGGLLQGE